MLRARDFERLTGAVDAKRAAVHADIRNESELHRVLETFAIGDPSLAALIEEWMAAAPESASPYLARASHSYELAFDARGRKYANQTSDEQIAGMERHLAEVAGAADAALERDPRSTEAYRMLIKVATARGDQQQCGAVARDALAIAPASFRVRWSLAQCRLPRWGGSRRAVEAIWEQARPFAADNPELAVLAGVLAWDQGRLLDGEPAMQLLNRSVAAGPYSGYFFERAREQYFNGSAEAALEDATMGLALSPQHPDLLSIQFQAYFKLGRHNDAGAVLDVFAEVDPTDEYVPIWRKELQDLSAADAADSGGGGFQETLRADAVLAQRGDWDGIIQRWSTYLGTQPNDGRAYLERAGAWRQKGDMQAARADIERACTLSDTRACAIAQSQGWR
jgi:tetratricopeptide (TPR) repeat protein